MTHDQARKLLGGYATNTLTEAERKALFEAALDDQELFDALQQEEALKELLADPVARSQIQRALAEPPDAHRAAAWWSRGRLWGGLAGAVAAAVLMIVVIRSNTPPRVEIARVVPTSPQVSAERGSPALAAPPSEPKPAPRARAERPAKQPGIAKAVTDSLNDTKEEARAAAAPPPPPPPVPAPTPRMQALRAAPMAGGGGARFVTNFQGSPLLRYSLVKRDTTGAYAAFPAGALPQLGDSIRLSVLPAIAGYLSLEQLDPQGDWKRLFPAADPVSLVAANASQTIPDSPIIMTGMEQQFRLKLVPADSKDSAAVTVDITIGPGKP